MRGKILITGGTGSFGNAVADRLLNDSDTQEIRILSRDEKKQHDMRLKYNDERLKFYLGDVRDISSIKKAFTGVDYVFHAAALKQVPSCEFFPLEAVKTNVIGTSNVLTCAVENKIKSAVVLSTDKAAYPINAMGMSKALMEKVAIGEARSNSGETRICVTRYGNVMGSRGSVIPLFLDLLSKDERLTVTDGNMTRFMMTLEEAVDLVLFALESGDNGDLFVQKASSSTIYDLIKALEIVSNRKSQIEIIGLRHGEKMYETLVTSEEMIKAEDLGGYYRIPMDSRSLNYSKYYDGNESLTRLTDFNSDNCSRISVKSLATKILETKYINK